MIVDLILFASTACGALALPAPPEAFPPAVVWEEDDDESEDDDKAPDVPPPPCKNMNPPADFDDKRATELLLLIEEFKNAEGFASGGELMKKVIGKIDKQRKRLECPVLHYMLGKGAHYLREIAHAEEELNAAIAANPRFYEAEAELAAIAGERGDWGGAIAHYSKALETYPHYLPALDGAARAHVRNGTPEKATELFERAASISRPDEYTGVLDELKEHLAGPSWDHTFTAETANYIVKTSKSQAAADQLAALAEEAWKIYLRFVPSLARGEKKFEIYFYAEADCGKNGPEIGEGGYYSPLFRRLKICDFGESSTLERALKRQAIAQALHAQSESIPLWLVRGLQEFFDPANLALADAKECWVRYNTMQQGSIVRTIRNAKYPMLPEFMLMNDRDYKKKLDINDGQAWATVYFCMQGSNPKYQKALHAYMESCLKGESPGECFAKSFAKIDTKKFDTEWKKFIVEEVPKISKGL